MALSAGRPAGAMQPLLNKPRWLIAKGVLALVPAASRCAI